MPTQYADLLSTLKQAHSLEALVAATVLMLLVTALRWLNLSERRWKLRSMKHKPFRQLIRNDAWRKVSPYEFHAAMQDAFGRSIEPIEFAFIQTRARPMELLKNRLAAGPWMRFDAEKLRYRGRGDTPIGRRAMTIWGFVSTLAGIAFMAIAGTLAWLALSQRTWGWVPAAEICAALAFIGLLFGSSLEAAAELSRWGERHPEASPIPAALKPRKRIVPKDRKDPSAPPQD
jgi:hypothetical protein